MNLILTASHLDCHHRITLLKECINTTKVFNGIHYISVSKNDDINIGDSFDIYNNDPNVKIFFHNERKSQFEHLNFILMNIINRDDLDDNGLITFLDDDDILLSLPNKECQGVQYLVNDQEYRNHLHKKDEINRLFKEIVIDFSGYTLNVKNVYNYFNNRKPKIFIPELRILQNAAVNMEDITFMKYSDKIIKDKNDNLDTKPFVIHRLWDNPQSWNILNLKS